MMIETTSRIETYGWNAEGTGPVQEWQVTVDREDDERGYEVIDVLRAESGLDLVWSDGWGPRGAEL
jgi:hypothetical protein